MSLPGHPPPRRFDAFSTKLALVYGLLVASLLGIVVVRLQGGFSYSLDDAYIHLALAQEIAHGHYGINPGEPSSPASSILWPFLLAPFGWMPLHRWVPLVVNVGFGFAECVLLGRLALRTQLLGRTPSNAAQWMAAVAAVVSVNLVGLTFLGMEHVLQTVLMTGCLWAVVEAYEGRPVPTWALWMAAMAPSVRYEDLAFTLAVALASGAQHRWRAGGLTLAGSLLPLGLFSLFLHHQGLPPLPSSVLVKGGVAGAHPAGAIHGLLLGAWQNLITVHDGQVRTLTPGLLVLLAALWLDRRSPVRRNALLCASAAIALLYVFGPYGWFYRYDAAFRSFLLLVCLVVLRGRRFGPATSLLLLLGWISFDLRPLMQTADACTGIYRQQYQMHRFEDEFWRKSVALDDLGWVSVDHRDGAYVLDLDGLASPEAAMQRNKDAAWLRGEVARHGVGLAMIYPKKFESIPAEWVKLGTLKQTHLNYGLLGGREVDLYATSPGSALELAPEVAAFRKTLPGGVSMD